MRITMILGIMSLYVSGCGMRLSSSDYLDYLNKNEEQFSVETTTDVNYQLIYTPVEQIVAENQGAFSKDESKAELKNMKNTANSMFKLKITVPSGNLFSQHVTPKAEQMEYYSVGFKDHVKAVTVDSDTVNCKGYFFQASAGFGTSSYFEFEFPQHLNNMKEVLLYPKYLDDSAIVIQLSALHHNYPELKIK